MDLESRASRHRTSQNFAAFRKGDCRILCTRPTSCRVSHQHLAEDHRKLGIHHGAMQSELAVPAHVVKVFVLLACKTVWEVKFVTCGTVSSSRCVWLTARDYRGGLALAGLRAWMLCALDLAGVRSGPVLASSSAAELKLDFSSSKARDFRHVCKPNQRRQRPVPSWSVKLEPQPQEDQADLGRCGDRVGHVRVQVSKA